MASVTQTASLRDITQRRLRLAALADVH